MQLNKTGRFAGIREIILRLIPFFMVLFLFQNSMQAQHMWQFDMLDISFGQAAVADLDEDGKPEIVFSTYMNDGKVYALNAEDGSLLWEYSTGDCNDAAPLVFDVDLDGHLDVVLASSCIAKTYCFDGMTGGLKWQAITGGTDSPPVAGDVDNDGKPEILHGQFNGTVICLNGEDGGVAWTHPVASGASVQTSPALLDCDGDGQLDFVVALWSFSGENAIYAFRGDNQAQLWVNTEPLDYIYHGASFGDLDLDGKPELAIGSYDNFVYLLNAEDGSLKWKHDMGPYCYVGGPTQMADLNNDGLYEVLACGWYKVKALDTAGNAVWTQSLPGYDQSFRGAAISDIDNDGVLDALYGTNEGFIYGLRGTDGNIFFTFDLAAVYGDTFDIDHAPVIADFDDDGLLDAFVAGGKTYYPNTELDYGAGFAFHLPGGVKPAWMMFQHDIVRSSRVPLDWASQIPENPANRSFDLSVFPNPCRGALRVSITTEMPREISISLIDRVGKTCMVPQQRKLFNDQVIELRPGDWLEPGVYFLKVTGGDQAKILRIILL